jgi:hypothetical protein
MALSRIYDAISNSWGVSAEDDLFFWDRVVELLTQIGAATALGVMWSGLYSGAVRSLLDATVAAVGLTEPP